MNSFGFWPAYAVLRMKESNMTFKFQPYDKLEYISEEYYIL